MNIVDGTDNVRTIGKDQIVQPAYIPTQPASITDTTPRIYSRQLLSGNIRGAQNVTGSITITNPDTNKQDIVLDGSKQSITVTNSDGSIVGMGLIPDGSNTFGFFTLNAQGQLLMKIVGSTIYTYDLTYSPSVNIMQILKLPDGSYGWAVAAQGKNVSDGIS